MEFFVKHTFILSSHTLTKVSNYIVCKIAVPPSIFWKRERDWHKHYERMWTQLRNVFKEFVFSIYVDVGSLCLFVRGPTPPVKQPELNGVSYWFCTPSLTRSQKVIWCLMWWQDQKVVLAAWSLKLHMSCIRQQWNIYLLLKYQYQ